MDCKLVLDLVVVCQSWFAIILVGRLKCSLGASDQEMGSCVTYIDKGG